MEAVVEINTLLHEVAMGYYDEAIPFDKIEFDKIVEDMDKSCFFNKMLINPEKFSIFAENENFIIASIDIDDLNNNIARLEALTNPLTTTTKDKLKQALHDNIPRYPKNPKSRYISCFVAEYPNVSGTFKVKDYEGCNTK